MHHVRQPERLAQQPGKVAGERHSCRDRYPFRQGNQPVHFALGCLPCRGCSSRSQIRQRQFRVMNRVTARQPDIRWWAWCSPRHVLSLHVWALSCESRRRAAGACANALLVGAGRPDLVDLMSLRMIVGRLELVHT